MIIVITVYVVFWITKDKRSIRVICLDCSDDFTVTHNSSMSSTPLYFNETTVLRLESVFQIPYSLPITYVWYINGERLPQTGNYLDYFFGEGNYNVTAEASYKIPRCEPCVRTQTIPIIVDGTRLHKSLYVQLLSKSKSKQLFRFKYILYACCKYNTRSKMCVRFNSAVWTI